MSEDYEYELCYVDFDTPLYAAAQKVQQNFIVVTHKDGKYPAQRFKGVTEFCGHHKKKEGGWIGEENIKLAKENLPEISADEFEIEECAELKELPYEYNSHLDWAMESIDYKVGDIKKTCKAKDYVLGIGGRSNFRFEEAHILPYKGKRKAKPIFFEELREAFIKKYKNKVSIARDGLEQDDEISIKGWESYAHFLKTGKHKYVLAFIDKDLSMVPCPSFNYDKCEEGINIPTIEECAKAFCIQLLSGDKGTDNIQGLPNFSVEFCEKYSLGKTRGIGKPTAIAALNGCNTPKEMYERVIEAYKSYYGEEPFDFTSFRGVESKRTWLDMLKENAILLYMMRKFGERFNIEDTFKRLNINY